MKGAIEVSFEKEGKKYPRKNEGLFHGNEGYSRAMRGAFQFFRRKKKIISEK